MKTIPAIAAFLLAGSGIFCASAKEYTLNSPDGNIGVTLSDADSEITLSAKHGKAALLQASPIALDIQGVKEAKAVRKVKSAKNISETIEAPFYRQAKFNVTYNELEAKLDNGVTIQIRAFDEGFAYRFLLKFDKGKVIVDETADYKLPGDPTVYLSHSTNDKNPLAMAFQNIYEASAISHANDRLAFLPATVDYGDGLKMTILESDLKSYPGMWLKADTTALKLKATFAPYPAKTDYYPWRRQLYVTEGESFIAKVEGSRALPWRIFAITSDDRQMPVNNLVYALAEPSKVADTSWIKPGKVAWDWWNDWGLKGVPFKAGINNDTYKYYIDFAADNGIEFVVLDEGWYDPKSGDMLTVIPELDLPMLVGYAKEKGVGIVLWTVFNVLDSQLEEACKKYSDMGVVGFKVDFLDRDDQTAVEMTHRLAEACARHHLTLDYHGIYKPVGLNRTYPNILNYEAVFGMEETKWTDIANNMPLYDVTFPFIRMMAGQVDYTPGAMRNASKTDWKAIYYNPMSMGTRAHQLAAYIVHDSPFTMLCDAPTNYLPERECLDFIAGLPTVFDETKVVDGKMGEYIVTARQKNGSWYVGGMTNWDPRDLSIDFSFLPQGQDYKVVLISDGINADKQAEDYTRREITDVNSATRLDLHLASGGGFAMRLDPQPDFGQKEWSHPENGRDSSADVAHDAPGAMNPIIPGYFADPTVKKFGDTYYIYATTDGSGAGFGPAQLWTSKDFVNWTIMPMNWPDSHWIWAPDVMQNQHDGKFYYIYCQPCQIHAGVGDTPRGPWKNILGESEAVLVPDRFVHNAITLDGQTFVDDDGSIYMYWGTWGIYDGFGCGAGRLAPDMKSFTETRLIPNTEVTDFFEAPFVLKKNGKYYFMYSCNSCHDSTYNVRYATADHPLGPYTYHGRILETNADGTVHGPGHHSILQDGDDYYIVYHRHDNPHSNRGFHRQIAVDRLEFAPDGSIKIVTPTHHGIGALAPSVVKSTNLAFNRPVRASSFYDDNFKPSFAVDDNNGTLWRPASMGQEWLEIDLGRPETVKSIWTQWEYGTQFYQYLIETSLDGQNWRIFSDKRQNRLAGSPMVDFGDAKARYVRLTFTGGQKAGFPGAIWNVKIFGDIEDANPQQWLGLTGRDWNGRRWLNNEGQLGGAFDLVQGQAEARRVAGRDAIVLSPGAELIFKNAVLNPDKPYTLTAQEYKDGKWQKANLGSALSKGQIAIKAGADGLTLANLRMYNWQQQAVETDFDLSTDIVRLPVADYDYKGLVVDIDANRFNAGDTIPWIPNGEGIDGYFETQAEPAVVEEIDGRKAIRFNGQQDYRSNFSLPATLRDNCPYTLEMVILNPEIAENEAIADFTTTHDELEKIMAVNGTEPRCGVMQHYAWYEDAGWPEVKNLAGQWQHVYVCFDGRMEHVYINDKLVSEKDIQLLVKPSQYVTLGRNAEHEWPFTGYLHSLKLWDEYHPYNNKTH